METATDYDPKEWREYNTRLWIADCAAKDFEKLVDPRLAALLEKQARKGFQQYRTGWLREEGQGIVAYGTTTWTTRIAGFFGDDATRTHLVIGGIWYGKPGRGGKRPPMGDTVVDRVAVMKKAGVLCVGEFAKGPGERPEVAQGQVVLPAQLARGSRDAHSHRT